MTEIFDRVAQLVIGLVLLTGAFGFFYRLYFSGVPIPAVLQDSLLQVVGGIMALIGAVVGFYFGTSLSSARKDSTIAASKRQETP